MAAFSRRRAVVNLLRTLWVVIILWYEYGVFLSDVRVCNWPDINLVADAVHARPYHVLLVADPQIVDRYSYPSRGVLLSYLTRLVVDLNLRKNWRAALHKQPDAVVFLGDMMDNGRYDMSDEEYEGLFERFSSIFRMEGRISQYFIPGNHDIGLGKSSTFSPNAHARYVAHFGAPNYEVSLANHSLVFFDALTYADEDAKRHGQRKNFNNWVPIAGGSLDFRTKFASKEHTDPVILFSHIPLYRSDGKACGPLRERGTLRPGVGHGYQNTLEKQATQRLLEALKPVAVFSGDDHDYCEYTHQLRPAHGPPQTIPEITVKTISMVMNVRRPGFQLLSLAPAESRQVDSPSYADTPCLLPDQLTIYLGVYLPLLAISIIIVFLSNLSRGKRLGHSKDSSDGHVFFSTKPENPNDHESTELGTYYNSSSSHGLPVPISAVNQNKHSSRSSRTSGWFVIQGQGPETHRILPFDCIQDALHFICPAKSRSTPHRRGWLSSSMRDIRDVAVFPVGVFVLITWWIVTR